jgi:hypothetical protein
LAQRCAEIAARIQLDYSEKMAHAGFFRRIWLTVCMNRETRSEVKREKNRLAPPDALYLRRA